MKIYGYLSVIILIFLENIRDVAPVRCYKCILAPYIHYSNKTLYKCKDIDYSDKFVVDCPYSTFCMKKVTGAKIPVPINGIERDCAYQKLETQRVENGKWHPEVRIEEPYDEGCFKLNDKGLRTSTIEYCYCKGDLCNGAPSLRVDCTILLALFVQIYRFL